MKILKVFAIGVAGGFIGCELGVFFACMSPESGNLCGLLGFIITGPLGFLAGAIGSFLVLSRQRQGRGGEPLDEDKDDD
jgi:hypothetical protein